MKSLPVSTHRNRAAVSLGRRMGPAATEDAARSPTGAASAQQRATLPPPLVRPLRHPLVWARQHVAMLALKAVLAYVGILIVAALYYVLLETHVKLPLIGETNTQAWHRLVPDNTLRHNIRDVGEGLLGGLLGIAFTYNHYRHVRRRAHLNAIDRTEIALAIPNVKDDRRLSAWQAMYGLLLIPVYAAVGFFAAEAIVSAVHPYVNHAIEHETGNLLFNIKANVIENWPKKVIGLAAAFCFGHRPAKALIDDLQLWFAERRVERGAGLRRYDTPTFKARYNELVGEGEAPAAGTVHARGGAARRIATSAVLLVGVAAAGYGYYVLNYIAKGHG
jgi:hypothetical protein